MMKQYTFTVSVSFGDAGVLLFLYYSHTWSKNILRGLRWHFYNMLVPMPNQHCQVNDWIGLSKV